MKPCGHLPVLLAFGLAGCQPSPSNDENADGSESTETGTDEICDGQAPGPDIIIAGPNDFDEALGLECIPGKLLIVDENIGSLVGLEPLTAIGTLEIRNTLALESLDGLQNVLRIDHFVFRANRNLEDFQDLSSLEEISELDIVSNPGLTSLKGLEAITDLADASVHSNENLASLTGLDGLAHAGRFSIQDDVALTNLQGIGALTQVDGDLELNELGMLESLDGIAVQSVGGELHIEDNPLLCQADAEAWAAMISVTGPTIIDDNLDDCIP